MLQTKWVRIAILLFTLLFYGYCNYYYWFIVPFPDFVISWEEAHTATVDEVRRSKFPLKVDDQLLAVNGIAVYRGQSFYRPPRRDTYLFMVRRDGKEISTQVPFERQPDVTSLAFRLPATLLSFTFLLLGGVSLFLIRSPNSASLKFSYLMLFSGTVVIALQGALLNVPGALYVAHPGFFLLGAGWVHLGKAYVSPLGKLLRVISYIIDLSAVILACIALWEIVFLYPNLNSVEALVGVNILRTTYLFFGLCLLISLGLLIGKTINNKDQSYQTHNIKILLLLHAIAIVPTVLFTFVSQSLQDEPLMPFPVAIILSLLIPLSYFFVIFRRGIIFLDVVFHRGLVIILVLILSSVIFAALQFTVKYSTNIATDISTSVLIFIPTYLIAQLAYRPTNQFAQRVIYGDIDAAQRETLPLIAREFSRSPQLSTLQEILSSLAEELQIVRGLLLFQEDGIWQTKAHINCPAWRSRKPLTVSQSLLRSSEIVHPLFDLFSWAELIIPIKLRGNIGGLLILARPDNAYYNRAQVIFFERIADMIGVGYDAIRLFETTRRLSARMTEAQETERQKLALNLHDNALQSLTILQNQLTLLAGQNTVNELGELADVVKEISLEIRNVCEGLYPLVLSYGDIRYAIETIKADCEQEFGMAIACHIEASKAALEGIPDNVTKAAYYITKEALNNVAKHASVNEAQVTVCACEDKLSLFIEDQGIGIATTKGGWMATNSGYQFGLMGMQDRADAVDGVLVIEPNMPQGTRVNFQVAIESIGEAHSV